MDWLDERSERDALAAIGHRIVHGGPKYFRPQRITPSMVEELHRLSPFDPDHLPEEIIITEAFHRRFPDLPQVACFDTAFHHDMPRVAQMLPIPRRYEAQGVRRYGFHRLSYAFLMQELARLGDDERNIWKERYRSIVDLENHLYRNGTRILKFFLHLSKNEQRKRFLERIDEPTNNWTFSLADIHERKYWKDYTNAYEECLRATSTHNAPWYIVPADDKENARLIVSRIVIQALKKLKMAFPETTPKRRRELKSIGARLAR